MDKHDKEEIVFRAKNIERNIEHWDLYAKIMPSLFLVLSILFMSFGIVDFDTMFYVGLTLFAITGVTWWFWTLFSIKFLLNVLRRASNNLVDVSDELRAIKADYQEITNEQIKEHRN